MFKKHTLSCFSESLCKYTHTHTHNMQIIDFFIYNRSRLCFLMLLTHCEVASYVVGTQRNVMPLQADGDAVVLLYFGAILLMAACDVVAERFSAIFDDEDVSMPPPPTSVQSDGGANNF